MSAKLIYSLTDENKDMRGQVGCMNGIFQLFDRHHFMAGRRLNNKRLPPPGDYQQRDTENELHKANEVDLKAKFYLASKSQACTDKNLKNSRLLKNDPTHSTQYGHRVFCESPKASVSSSTCPSMPTYSDSYKTVLPEATPVEQETPFRHTQSSQSPALSRRSIGLRDVVKDSSNREVLGLSAKLQADKNVGSQVKHIDSPRPFLFSKPVKAKAFGLDASFNRSGKFQDVQPDFKEGRDRSLLMTRKEPRRFSCDGRVSHSQDTLKSTLKLKDQPRLSLDSRPSSMRRSTPKPEENYYQMTRLENANYRCTKLEQQPGSSKRTSSVVAKLMGLDMLKDSSVISKNKSAFGEPPNKDQKASVQTPASGIRINSNEHSVQLKTCDSGMRPMSTSRISVELAPWKQAEAVRGLQKPGVRYGEDTKNAPNSMPSVYGEIEKRLTELEFKKSSKDLRALKQILGAMQKSKDSLQTKKDIATESIISQSSDSRTTCGSQHQDLKSENNIYKSGNSPCRAPNKWEGQQSTRATPLVMKTTNSPRNIYNQASAEIPLEGLSGLRKLRTSDNVHNKRDLVDKHISSERTQRNRVTDASSPTLRTDKIGIASPKATRLRSSRLPQPLPVGNNLRPNSGTVSPTLLERQLRQTNPSPSELNKVRQPTDARSPGKKINLIASSLQSRDKLSECRKNTCSSLHGDPVRFDAEVKRTTYLDETTTKFFRKSERKQDTTVGRLGKYSELNTITPEQPSPVSILDAMFCGDESPSPVKKISYAFTDDESLNPEEQGWSIKDIYDIADSKESFPIIANDQDKEFSGSLLVEELVDLYSATTRNSLDYSLPDHQGKTQDHGFIFEILLASGLLHELGSGSSTLKLHPRGCVIQPEVFEVLEKSNTQCFLAVDDHSSKTVSQQSIFNEKIRRKLIFDVVNEILGRKLEQSSYNELSLLSYKVADRSQAKLKLLKDLYSEIDQLQDTSSHCNYEDEYNEGPQSMLWEDIKQVGPNGNEFRRETSELVLHLERLVFKDLISEVISDAAEGPRTRRNGHCRQLFS